MSSRKTPEVERVSRLVSDPSCRGVIGEIVVQRSEPPRRSRVPTSPGIGTSPLDWRRALIEREAARLAHQQLERLSP